MSNLEYFKKQAKNLLRDWQTQTKTVEEDGLITYNYSTKFYDVGDLFFYYEFSDKDEQDIKLARAQHLISQMVGFTKWTDLVAASEKELEYAEILLRNFKNSEDIINWENAEMFSGIARFDIDSKIEFAKQYFKGIRSDSPDESSTIKPKILMGKEREAALRVGLSVFGSKKMRTKVKCIHCDDEYMYKEANAVLYPYDAEPFIMCKNYPKCDGSLMDLMSQEDDDNEDLGMLYDPALTWTSDDD